MKNTGSGVGMAVVLSTMATIIVRVLSYVLEVVLGQGAPAATILIIIILSPIAFVIGTRYDQKLEILSRDKLTGVYNRHYSKYIDSKLIPQALYERRNLCLSIIDIDDFKKINDLYGHDKGDHVLRSMARALKRSLRNGEFVIRWGGDEFIIAYIYNESVEQKAIEKRLIDKIQLLSKESNINIPLSVSIGSASYPSDGKTLDELRKVADHKLYDEKRLKNEIKSNISQ